MVKTMEKEFWKSKTKIGALLIGIGAVLGTVGGMLNGTVDVGAGITLLIAEVGGVLTLVGIRNAL